MTFTQDELRAALSRVAERQREETLRVLASATRKVLSPELVTLVEVEIRRGLAGQYTEPVCGNWTPEKAKEAAALRAADPQGE